LVLYTSTKLVRENTGDPLPLYAAVVGAVVVAVGMPAAAVLHRMRTLAKAEAQVLLLMDTPTEKHKAIPDVPFHSPASDSGSRSRSPERALVVHSSDRDSLIHSPASGSGRVVPL
jgi:hypothetical protein